VSGKGSTKPHKNGRGVSGGSAPGPGKLTRSYAHAEGLASPRMLRVLAREPPANVSAVLRSKSQLGEWSCDPSIGSHKRAR
jgi:hypothetical protein